MAAQESTPGAVEQRPPAPIPASRLSAIDPLNGGYLIVNMHGLLFHRESSDLTENLAYARWLGSGVIRVFGTDNNGFLAWDGRAVGARIVELAPALRAARMKLIVAFVNNHRAVPGEDPSVSGWKDGYIQLLLPFYVSTWRGAYLNFVRDVITTVQMRGAPDVIQAWELGNELHTPDDPRALLTFVNQAVAEIRALDPVTPILPGTMGSNHVEPYVRGSAVARTLYCEAPVDAYTLHAYDWISRDRPGDMPIDWDLDTTTVEPCPSGRRLPVIVEELGTSRALPGIYSADNERERLKQEVRQIEFVRQFPQVVGFGVWNGESPRVIDRTFLDIRRGLTSYGPNARGGGSCYDPLPEGVPGARCQLEQALRQLAFVHTGTDPRWLPLGQQSGAQQLGGALEAAITGDPASGVTIDGRIEDPSARDMAPLDGIAVLLGAPAGPGSPVSGAQVVFTPTGMPPVAAEDGTIHFRVQVPLNSLPAGTNVLSLVATAADRTTWFRSLVVTTASLGPVLPAQVAAVPTASTVAVLDQPPRLDVHWPSPGSQVPASFVLEGSAIDGMSATLPGGQFDVQIFMEPGRDRGGRLVGAARSSDSGGATFRVLTTVPRGEHTLDVHVRWSTIGREAVAQVQIVV